jgi:hypothetical protein
LPHPIDNKAVRRQQTQFVLIMDGLKRPDPSIEMLLRQIMLELLNTFVPERSRHRGVSQESKREPDREPRSLYRFEGVIHRRKTGQSGAAKLDRRGLHPYDFGPFAAGATVRRRLPYKHLRAES